MSARDVCYAYAAVCITLILAGEHYYSELRAAWLRGEFDREDFDVKKLKQAIYLYITWAACTLIAGVLYFFAG